MMRMLDDGVYVASSGINHSLGRAVFGDRVHITFPGNAFPWTLTMEAGRCFPNGNKGDECTLLVLGDGEVQIGGWTFSNFRYIKSLTLFIMPPLSLRYSAFDPLTKLTELRLHCADYVHLTRDSFGYVPNLKKLHLEYTQKAVIDNNVLTRIGPGLVELILESMPLEGELVVPFPSNLIMCELPMLALRICGDSWVVESNHIGEMFAPLGPMIAQLTHLIILELPDYLWDAEEYVTHRLLATRLGEPNWLDCGGCGGVEFTLKR